jgi:uncharacterized phage protein (TIGR01671 family)
MRDIKFRAWDNIDNIMRFDVRKHKNGRWVYDYRQKFVGCKDGINKVMQFTGLQDRNGVDIYEGDILEYCEELPDGGYSNQKYTVEFKNGSFVVCCEGCEEDNLYSESDDASWLVVGNIHENSELLKG